MPSLLYCLRGMSRDLRLASLQIFRIKSHTIHNTFNTYLFCVTMCPTIVIIIMKGRSTPYSHSCQCFCGMKNVITLTYDAKPETREKLMPNKPPALTHPKWANACICMRVCLYCAVKYNSDRIQLRELC